MCPMVLPSLLLPTQLDMTFYTVLYFYYIFYYILPLALECHKKWCVKECGNATHTWRLNFAEIERPIEWDSCLWLRGDPRTFCLRYPEVGGSCLLQKVGTYLWKDTASYPRRRVFINTALKGLYDKLRKILKLSLTGLSQSQELAVDITLTYCWT